MWRSLGTLLLLLTFAGWIPAQDRQSSPGHEQPSPQSEDRNREAGESSSRDTRIDLSPPGNDAKNHPDSAEAVAEAEGDNEDASPSDVKEFHPWNPHKAAKDVEVGDFYFKRKNYRAALSRYKEALVYKDNDALANFRLAQCLEKLDQPDQAKVHYQAYLKILPHGPFAEEAQKALERLTAEDKKAEAPGEPQPKP